MAATVTSFPIRRRGYYYCNNIKNRSILGYFFLICFIVAFSRIKLSSDLLNNNESRNYYQNEIEDSTFFQPPKIVATTSSSITNIQYNMTRQTYTASNTAKNMGEEEDLITITSTHQHNNIKGDAVINNIIGNNNNDSNLNHTTRATTPQITTTSSLSICLLLKDDNDILNEWIAYHYHTLNLRHMIVAIDPSSQTSPTEIFDMWTSSDHFNMTIEIWNDHNYMPDYFLQGHYDQVPSFLPQVLKDNITKSRWHNNHNQQQEDSTTTTNTTKIQLDLLHINNHRFRQVTFVSKCYEEFMKKKTKKSSSKSNWIAHIDTDEYIVINSNILKNPNIVEKGGVSVPMVPSEGSIMKFLEDMFLYYPKRLSKKCIMMPTKLFGSSKEEEEEESNMDKNSSILWNRTKFETIRWKYHANYSDIINGLQKAIVDVSQLSLDHNVFASKRIYSVHQPLEKPDCRKYTLKPDITAVRLYPLVVNHYLGSIERYTSRADIRRQNMDIYKEKSSKASILNDSNWIQGWLSSFVHKHKHHATEYVLKDYIMKHQ